MLNRIMFQRVLPWSRGSRHSLRCFFTTSRSMKGGNSVIYVDQAKLLLKGKLGSGLTLAVYQCIDK